MNEAQRKKLSRDIELPELTAADYRRALRKLLERMPQLALGTIDGFFHRVLGMFSLEYGLSGEFEIMDEFTAQRARLRALDQLFAAAATSEADRQALLKSFELMSAGQQDRRIYDVLEQYLRDCHSVYHSAPGEQVGPTRNDLASRKSMACSTVESSDTGAGLSGCTGSGDRV